MTKKDRGSGWAPLALLLLAAAGARAEVMLQWFETEWNEIYRRMPEVAEFGYDYIWTPPPTKAPTGLGTKWGNVGYNLYDRFDLGDVPQRGSLATRYGTRGALRQMVDAAHRCDVKIIPDIVMNHNGNGPDFRSYPGMVPEDFHVQWEPGHANTLNYRRGPRMDQWHHGEGYGGTMWQELVSLIDIRTEDDGDVLHDPKRFTGNKDNNTPGWNFVDGASYLRHVGRYDRYPYGYDGSAENVRDMLNRWIVWLGNAMDFDGLRLDAGKHVPWEFFGGKGWGFLHEAQHNYNNRYGHGDGDQEEADELFANYLSERNDALIFAEILSYQGELAYWFGGPLDGPGNCTRNPMRFLDYPLKQKLYDAFSNGNLAGLSSGGGGIHPQLGIMYAWGHDEAGPSKIDLAYAYILTHIGFPMVYFTGNNITWDDNGTRTWMRPGYDSQALGDAGNAIGNLIWIHQQFARGAEYDRWNENDFFVYERYADDGDGTPEAGEGLLLVGLNDSGYDQTRNNVTVSFAAGTWLHDYSGHNPNAIEVYYNASADANQVNLTIPGNYGQGWVCYAPRIAEGAGEAVRATDNGSPAGTMPWVVPGGIHADDKTRQITRITSTNLVLDVYFTPAADTTVDYVAYKWGRGTFRTSPGTWHTNRNDSVLGHYQDAVQRNATNWYVDIPITDAIPEGLNTVKFRVFNQRPNGYPELFNTFTKLLYIDRRGPGIAVGPPADGATVHGEAVMVITNTDHTAYGMAVSLDGGGAETAHEIMTGLWTFDLRGLSSGTHTALVTTTEADWATDRQVINTSVYTRVFNVVENTQTIGINHAQGATLETPFFTTAVTAPGAPDRVTLYWDGYALPFNAGGTSNVFNGEVVMRDHLSNVATDRLWGAFCNGQHVFEAERVDAGVTSRVVRRVTFNLYGINAIDSDGDGLPDNVEMPFIDSDGAPGADAPWPGDSNKDFVPNYGETWTRLNPYNHSTFYSGQWDDQNDFDGDGYSNGDEVLAGYLLHDNIYTYDIYDASSHPAGPILVPSEATWDPEYAVRGRPLRITYTANEGPLDGETPVHIHVGHSLRSAGEWQDVTNYVTAATGTSWFVDYAVPSNATSVDFVFRNASADTWDNNNGNDWQAGIQASTNRWFVMDGTVDSEAYRVYDGAMPVYAAFKGENLYVATDAAGYGGDDHFIFITDAFGYAMPAPWSKAGQVFVDLDDKPYLAGEGTGAFNGWYNVSGGIGNDGVNALEGECNLIDAFGYIPDAVYIAAVAYGTEDGGGITSQGPPAWYGDGNLDTPEFLRVPIASVTDTDLDGHFDVGKPMMWTVVGADTNDANYGLRRFFVNELAGDTAELTVILEPNVAPGGSVSDVELFTNLNRRDFARLQENPGDISTASRDTYYRAYAMTDLGGGRYAGTLTVRKCGAYRINARYRVDSGPYVYYTDYGLRRDCAAVVSPRKALDLTLYELNPMIAEATSDDFYGRSTFEDMVIANVDRYDAINTNHFPALGMNMIWLQPIHPIGADNKGIDPDTGLPYDPGSPYAVRNYWKVNALLGDPALETNALSEFQTFVSELDKAGVGVMLDGTFNHSAWDCEIGLKGVEMGITTNPAALIRDVRPQWYSSKDNYGRRATHYGSASKTDIAPAPDRIDFPKWPDAADFYFGRYSTLVQAGVSDTNDWGNAWYRQYLREDDAFEGHDAYTLELWEYFASYPAYWLDRTGHPAGTPKAESWKGIDGLRCDFAQGLPSRFWEYCINRTRSLKWDFIFMAESLDGYADVDGNKRHGVGYRSARHFDVLNENFVFYWRGNFFDYPSRANPQSYTLPTQQALDARRQAFDASPILLNLTSHDEILPSHDPWRIFYAYAEVSVVDGVPMVMYGQEAGAENDFDHYTNGGEIDDALHNFAHYELNFGKWIPSFKRYNYMTNIWVHRDWNLQNAYGRVGRARLKSPALRSQNVYFLNDKTTGQYNPDIFAVAKVEAPGVSAGTQDVVFAFVNNNYWDAPDGNGQNVWGDFTVDVPYEGGNRFGIQPGGEYNLVDLISTNPGAYLWPSNTFGDHIIAHGITVGLTGNALAGRQAQYLKLVDVNASYPDSDGDGIPDYSDWDDDNDGLPDWWELAYGLNPTNATGVDGADGDKDGDLVSNADELAAGTCPSNATDFFTIEQIKADGSNVWVQWTSKTERDYGVQRIDTLRDAPSTWQQLKLRTAASNTAVFIDTTAAEVSNRFYRIMTRP
jgi:glycosidase